MTAGGEVYLVAEERGRLVAYAARRGREVTAVFVRPVRARTGLGATLVARLERGAAREGARSVFVRAAPGAVAFYAAAATARGAGSASRCRGASRCRPCGCGSVYRTRGERRTRPRRVRLQPPAGPPERAAPAVLAVLELRERVLLRDVLPGSSRVAFIAPMEVRIASVQASSAAASAATVTRSPAGTPFPTR